MSGPFALVETRLTIWTAVIQHRGCREAAVIGETGVLGPDTAVDNADDDGANGRVVQLRHEPGGAALVENEHRINQAVRGIRKSLDKL